MRRLVRILGFLLIMAALLLLAWPIIPILWQVPSSNKGSAIAKIMCFDEHNRRLIIHSSENQLELRSLQTDTGSVQTITPLDQTRVDHTMGMIYLSQDRTRFMRWIYGKPLLAMHDAQSGKLLYEKKPLDEENSRGEPRSVSFSHDGTLAAAQFRSEILVWKAGTGESYCRFMMHHGSYGEFFNEEKGPTDDMRFSLDNRYLAVCGEREGTLIYDLQKKYFLDVAKKPGIPHFIGNDRLAILSRRGGKRHPALFEIRAESVELIKADEPLADDYAVVSNNASQYFITSSKPEIANIIQAIPSWFPAWVKNKLNEWWFGKESVAIEITGHDIGTREVKSRMVISVVPYTLQFMVMPGTENQLQISEDGKYLAINDTKTIRLWEPQKRRSLISWLAIVMLSLIGLLLLFWKFVRRSTTSRSSGQVILPSSPAPSSLPHLPLQT
jgi:hypothetical protein